MSIQTFGFVPFQKNQIPFVVIGDKKYIAIKPICDAIGLNYAYASSAIKDSGTLSKHYSLQRMEGKDGKMYEMGCLPLMRLPAWLSGIDTNKVREQARPILEAFQEHCFDVLYAYFFGRQEAINKGNELFAVLHTKREYLRGLQSELKALELWQESEKTKKEIRALETEFSGYEVEIFGKQLELLSSPTI